MCAEVQAEAKVMRRSSKGGEALTWEAAFCEVITQQQLAASKLLGRVEAAHEEALVQWRALKARDPTKSRSELRCDLPRHIPVAFWSSQPSGVNNAALSQIRLYEGWLLALASAVARCYARVA